MVDAVTEKVPHSSSALPGINEDGKGRNALRRGGAPCFFRGALKRNLFSPPGGPAFPEGIEKFIHDGTLYEYSRVTPTPASFPKVKSAVFIGNIEPPGKGLS